MDYRKVAILSSVAILVIGGGVIGLVAWRMNQPSPSIIEQTGDAVPSPQDNNLPSRSGGATPIVTGTSSGGNTFVKEASLLPDTVTTIDPEAKGTACDTSIDDIDCDYDNLMNKEERERKTDPLKEDTDGDGLSDSSEIYVWKSDPLKARSIDPAMTDLEAVNAGKRDTR